MIRSSLIKLAAFAALGLASVPVFALPAHRRLAHHTSPPVKSTLAPSSTQPRPAAVRLGLNKKDVKVAAPLAKKASALRPPAKAVSSAHQPKSKAVHHTIAAKPIVAKSLISKTSTPKPLVSKTSAPKHPLKAHTTHN